MKSILMKKPGIDTIFAASDLSALGALLVLKDLKIKVPEQIGVAGYVNEPFSEFIEPSLTSTEQFGEDIGKTSARLIIEEMNGEIADEKKNISIPPKLIVRNSTLRNSP
jgi:LacI family transcriptional regulator